MNSAKTRILFLDRDGVLIRERGEYNYLPEHLIINEDVVPALHHAREAGFLFVVVTNQGGIAKGLYSLENAKNLNDLLSKKLRAEGISVSLFMVCPHHNSVSRCLCRKPGSLMIEKALAKLNGDPSLSFLIGDQERDIQAAQHAGIEGIRIEPNKSLLPAVNQIIVKSGNH